MSVIKQLSKAGLKGMAAHTYEPDIQGTEAGGLMKVPGQPGDIVKPCLKKTNNRDYKGLLQGLLPDWPLPGVAPTSVSLSHCCVGLTKVRPLFITFPQRLCLQILPPSFSFLPWDSGSTHPLCKKCGEGPSSL